MIHFVGFGKDLSAMQRASRVWGPPDFVHYHNDHRVLKGGEIGPEDIVVYARGSEDRLNEHSYNDSEVQ